MTLGQFFSVMCCMHIKHLDIYCCIIIYMHDFFHVVLDIYENDHETSFFVSKLYLYSSKYTDILI